MAKDITDEDLELLGELGVEAEPAQTVGRSAREQRIIAGFEEIERFVLEKGRLPEHGESRDIFERLYAMRLDRLRESAECREVLQELDPLGLLKPVGDDPVSRANEDSVEYKVRSDNGEELGDEELLSALGADKTSETDITQLTHVRSREEIRAAEEIAKRTRCLDFSKFEPVFAKVQHELGTGERKTLKYMDNAEVKRGGLFILDGQKVLVAEMGDPFISDYDRPDRRLRVIYDNGTESDLLLRSLQRALNKDSASRRITEPELGPLFSDKTEEGDLGTGFVYVLRSLSDHPFIVENRLLIHKIGVTGGKVRSRIVNAKKDPTYLLADVEIVATFKLANLDRKRLEALLHKFFAGVRLDMALRDRFGGNVEPKEWFLVPLNAINEAIQKLMEGTIGDFRYDQKTAQLARTSSLTNLEEESPSP